MNSLDGCSLEPRATFKLLKSNDGKPFPFEQINGGDGEPTVITSIDENSGAILSQHVTYEPQQLKPGAKL